jgi:Tfp pilus assembly protein PilN
MIRINLAKKQSKGGADFDIKNFKLSSLFDLLKRGGGAGGESEGPKFDLNNPIVRAAAAAGACYYLGTYFDDIKAEELKKVEVEIQKIEKEKDAVAQKLAKIKGWEPIKKQLEDDEKAIRLKLDVVKKLLEGRDAPSKILMQVAQAIPDNVWLTTLGVTDFDLKMSGSATSYNDVTDFMRALNGTSEFSDTTLNGIKEQVTGTENQQRTQQFELIVKRRVGG